jgi:hypothetical protein
LKPRARRDWMKPLDGMEIALMNLSCGCDKAFKQHKRKFANYMVAVIQSVMTWAMDWYIPNHDIRNVKPIKRPDDMPRANRPWTRSMGDGHCSSTEAAASGRSDRRALNGNESV